MYHPTRGGARGGQDQFTWEAVKDDKFRENYLGHSLMAPVGRWQQGKDLTWYAKDKNSDDAARKAAKEELQRIKDAEADALAVALGGKKKNTGSGNVTQQDLKNAIKMNDEDQDPTMEEKGLGYGHNTNNRLAQLSGASRELLPGTSSNNIPVDYAARQFRGIPQEGSDTEDSKSHRKEKKKKDKKKHKKHSHKHKHSRKHASDLYSDESDDDRHYKHRVSEGRGQSDPREDGESRRMPDGGSSKHRRERSRSRSPRRYNRSPVDRHRSAGQPSSSPPMRNRSPIPPGRSPSPDRRGRQRRYSRDIGRRRRSSYSRSPSREPSRTDSRSEYSGGRGRERLR